MNMRTTVGIGTGTEARMGAPLLANSGAPCRAKEEKTVCGQAIRQQKDSESSEAMVGAALGEFRRPLSYAEIGGWRFDEPVGDVGHGFTIQR